MDKLIGKIPDLISGRYLLGYLLPLFLIAFGNFALFAEYAGPDPSGSSRWTPVLTLLKPAPQSVIGTFGGLLILVAAAYVIAPLNVVARKFLESGVPFLFRGRDFKREWKRRRRLENELHAAVRMLTDSERGRREIAASSAMTRRRDSKLTIPSAVADEVRNKVGRYAEAVLRGDGAVGIEQAELATCFKEKFDLYTPEGELADLETEFSRLVDVRVEGARSRVTTLALNRDLTFPVVGVEPTNLGNISAALKSYAETRYGMDYDTFWSHLCALKSNDAAFTARHNGADDRLEFLVTMYFLSWPSFVWVFVYLFVGRVLTALIIFGATAAATAIYRRCIEETYISLALQRRAEIDLHRSEVLAALKLPLPKTPQEEKEIWGSAHRHIAYGEPANYEFQ